SITTEDPLRRELARLVGLPVVEPRGESLDHPDSSPGAEDADAFTRRIDTPEAAAPEPTHEVVQPSWHAQDTSVAFDRDDADDGSYSFVITPPVQPIPERTTDLNASWATWSSRTFEIPADAAPRRRTKPRIAAIIAAFLIVAILLAGLLVVVAPAATIAVTPKVEQIEVRLTYGLASAGQPFDVQFTPQSVSATVTTTTSIPTTGERFVPDATASGTLLLTNPSVVAVTIPAGTIAYAADGFEYATLVDVDVPAADPYGSQTFGSATVAVQATVPGTDANTDAETIYGQWDSGVFYTNRDAIAGGTMKRIATVSDADRAALESAASADLNARAPEALAPQISNGATLAPNSEQRGEPSFQFDHAVGDDATTLQVVATMAISAQVFDPAAMQQQAEAEVTRRLESAAADSQIVANSLSISAPQPLGDDDNSGYTIVAQANAQHVVDQIALDRLSSATNGTSVDATAAKAHEIGGVADVHIERSNSWLWSDMPLLSSRISIEVEHAPTATQVEAAPTGP
ncbi:MAG: baseplate J/gp47 family protein, partial [Thermomicrobiales bacterium]|nr:baseplate J/gp47 family protein [Thermomicrobiales bacterium]